jgi:hypothetical protein
VTQITLSRIPSSSRRLAALVLLCALVALPAFAAGEVETQFGGGSVSWQINRTSGAATLTVHTDAGVLVSRNKFDAGVTPVFQPGADGAYRWSLAVAPQLNAEQKAELEAARARGDEQAASRFEGIMVSGRFVVENGMVHETGVDRGSRDQDPVGGINVKDQVIPDDLIVQGSICTGFDCVNNESFGFDTIRLKENNLRIKFEDTSVGAFPSNDWQLTANDSASGGSNKFSIEDITGSRVPFTVTAGATTNSIFVDSSGRVGFRTSTPVLDLHVNTSNTPALRLEQNNSGGFTAQTWDVAGNEANFFVRDVTSGSRLSLRIRPGAPTSSLDISANGNVGIGTGSPDEKLHVSLSAATNDTALLLENNEAVRFDLFNNSSVNGGVPTTWFFQADSDANRTLKISKAGGGGTVVTINNRANANGTTFTVDGSVAATSFITTSTRDAKTDGKKVDALQVLEKVAALPIEQWRFKTEAEGVAHVGPYAEDFKAAFGLGQTDKAIELQDASGVALVAIQALYQEVQELKKQNAELRQQLNPKN